MSYPSADELLSHMRDAVRQSLEFTEGMDKDMFLADKRTQQCRVDAWDRNSSVDAF